MIASTLLASLLCGPAFGAGYKTYTNTYFLYSVDYPESWRVKELSKTAIISSPFESKQDAFAENVEIVAEDLSRVPAQPTLIDYYRKAVGGAGRLLPGFKLLEEAQTVWMGRNAVVNLYTMTDKGKTFRRRALTFMAGHTVYVMTYSAVDSEYDTYLPQAERIMKSIQVSP